MVLPLTIYFAEARFSTYNDRINRKPAISATSIIRHVNAGSVRQIKKTNFVRMKKLGLTLLTALVGGLIAVGGYKLFENKQESKMSFEERQQLHYASNVVPNVVSSTGNPDFTQAAAMVAPAVVHITTTYPGRSGSRSGGGAPFDLFEEFFGMPRQRQQPRSQPPAQATGSGVIISQDGYI